MNAVVERDRKADIKALERVVAIYEDLDIWRCRARRIQKVHGITREDLAEQCGVAHNTMQNFDSGNSRPGVEFMLALVRIESGLRSDEKGWGPNHPRRAFMVRKGYDKMADSDFNEACELAHA